MREDHAGRGKRAAARSGFIGTKIVVADFRRSVDSYAKLGMEAGRKP